MKPFVTYEKNQHFQLEFSEYCGSSFDNEAALGIRFVLLFIEEGTGIALINDFSIPYIAPCVFCLSEKEHCVIQKNENQVIRAIYFHPSIINSLLNFENIRELPSNVPRTMLQDKDMLTYFWKREDTISWKFSLGPVTGNKFVARFKGIHEQTTNQNADYWPCRSRSFIMEMIFILDKLFDVGLFESETQMENLQEDFYPILLYIYHNYDKKISISEITEEFHVSKTTIAQMFLKNVGESFLAYLNRIRITIAATMLRDTLLPVSEIMHRVGFSDQVHFLRTFKKYLGISPSSYREKYCWM